jgi:hypothetical protein
MIAYRDMALPICALLLTAGCDALTSVDASDVVQPSALSNASGAQALRLGAIARLYYTQNMLARSGGLLSDEFIAGDFNTTEDKRLLSTQPGSLSTLGGAVWINGNQARIDAGLAIDALRQFAPTPAANIGELYSVVAYTELFFGEALCAPLPLGATAPGTLTYGVPIPRDSIFQLASSHFDSALALSADTARFVNLARVGKGRLLLQEGRFADAAAEVKSVPTTFVFNAEYTAAVTAQNNAVYAQMAGKSIGVSNREGGNGLDYVAAKDPRVPTTLVGQGQDPVDIYLFSRFTSVASPIPFASGVEARLIEAEAALSAGGATTALGILNDLRATAITPALPALSPQTTKGAQVDQLFRERAFWLFASGHRLGDLRRLIRQYGRDAETVFPTGLYRRGTTYGPAVTLTPDASELSNPNFVNTVCDNRVP